MNLYKTFLKPILFSFDAEKVHDGMTKLGESLEKEVLGVRFSKAHNWWGK